MAKIIMRRKGKVVHRESQTFETKPAAARWMKEREVELAKPGAVERANVDHPTLTVAIDRYIDESRRKIGRTKAQVLETIKGLSIADKQCDRIDSADIVDLAKHLSTDKKPQTVGNYLSHLAAIFAVARPAWGYPLDQQAMEDARVVTNRLGLTAKSEERERRPSLEELDRLMTHFAEAHHKRPSSIPMVKIVAFAIFSTRRQEEIVRIRWPDFEPENERVLVRDMKHPGQKIGNDTWCDLTPEAIKIMKSMPRFADEIFPYTTPAIGAAFTRACQFLGIEDLHFHDLRHDGVSRLFEIGWRKGTIPHIAAVSGHRSWKSLQRYTHIRERGDKYKGWKWLSAAVTPEDNPKITAKGELPRSKRSERNARLEQRFRDTPPRDPGSAEP